MLKNNFFTVTYQDDKVNICGHEFEAGYFAKTLMNEFYDNDMACRISVFRMENDMLIRNLKLGCIERSTFLKTGWEYEQMFKTIKKLTPFNFLDMEPEIEYIKSIFTVENEELLENYLKKLSDFMSRNNGYIYDSLEDESTKKAQQLIDEIYKADTLYHSIGEDMITCYDQIKRFSERLDEAEKLTENYLLPIAIEIFGEPELDSIFKYENIQVEGVNIVGKRFVFDSFKSFITTDFFEGLHHGHFQRQCPICKRYFLMLKGYRTKYCDGYAPQKINGKRVTCRKYAAYKNEKESADSNPLKTLYESARHQIRTIYSRRQISFELSEKAKQLAENRKYKAIKDAEYARNQYEDDMNVEKLISDAEKGYDE